MNRQSTPTLLSTLARDVFETLAAQFPVCLASDEFHFFPHYRSSRPDWSLWDDFSPDRVADTTGRIACWQQQLDRMRLDPIEAIDADMLRRVMVTLREQLDLVCFYQTQPSFYLTLISIGLAEAWEAGPQALARRVSFLPAFIDQIQSNLGAVPKLFYELAQAMLPNLKSWLAMLPVAEKDSQAAVAALQRLGDHLSRRSLCDSFLLPPDLYAQVAGRHIGCAMPLEAISNQLDAEMAAAEIEGARSAARLSPGKAWLAVAAGLPAPEPQQADPGEFYVRTIDQLKGHCINAQLALPAVADQCPVRIRTIPEHLLPVRSNAAFSMPPGHPPAEGTFYILPPARCANVPADGRLLTAHETYPGHYLLDSSRWLLPHPVRRPIEFPLFYEGWASFSEEILFDTGFFSSPADGLLMAKRRFWRALRGRTDLDIHTGRRTLQQAAANLGRYGLSPEKAAAMVRRYALKPGYQLSYTIGRNRFRQLYDRFRSKGRTTDEFVQTVLAQGEIGFDHLEAILTSTTNPASV